MTNDELNTTISNLKEAWKYPELYQNTAGTERWLSGATGTYLLIKGLAIVFSHPVIGLTGAAIGVGLLYRGITGYCPIRDLTESQKKNTVVDKIVLTETYVVDELG